MKFSTISRVGLFATVAVCALPSRSALAAQADVHFRLCTGIEAGGYYRSGHYLKGKSESVPVDVLTSSGSLENLDKLSRGECDGAFVQADSMLVFGARNAASISSIERDGVLYQEKVQLFCNRRSGISDISELTSNHTISVGPEGTGSRTTWNAFVLADKDRYADVKLDNRAGERVLAAVDDGSEVQCFLWVGATNSPFIKTVASLHGDHISIIPTNDSTVVKAAKDSRGNAAYMVDTIEGETYPRLARTTFYGSYKGTDVLSQDALFVANKNWVAAHGPEFDKILGAFTAAKPDIAAIAKP